MKGFSREIKFNEKMIDLFGVMMEFEVRLNLNFGDILNYFQNLIQVLANYVINFLVSYHAELFVAVRR